MIFFKLFIFCEINEALLVIDPLKFYANRELFSAKLTLANFPTNTKFFPLNASLQNNNLLKFHLMIHNLPTLEQKFERLQCQFLLFHQCVG